MSQRPNTGGPEKTPRPSSSELPVTIHWLDPSEDDDLQPRFLPDLDKTTVLLPQHLPLRDLRLDIDDSRPSSPVSASSGYFIVVPSENQETLTANIAEWPTAKQSYGISPAGRLIQSEGLLDLTLNSLRLANTAGYMSGDPSNLLIYFPQGLGGNGIFGADDFANWLAVMMTLPGFVSGVSDIHRRIRRYRFDQQLRPATRAWVETQGIFHPCDLRHWLNVKDDWTIDEVSQRLRLSDTQAAGLLRALGYSCPKGTSHWCRDRSKECQARRKYWKAMEWQPLPNDQQRISQLFQTTGFQLSHKVKKYIRQHQI
jgi:AraC-like DNA-binding protein